MRLAAIEAAQRQAAGTKLRADFTRIAAHHGDTADGRKIARVAVARKVVTLVYYGVRDGTIRSKAVVKAAWSARTSPGTWSRWVMAFG